jgi:hypothetical protein
VLLPESRLAGRIIDNAAGSPVAGASVTAVNREFRTEHRAKSNENGEFVFSNLASGVFSLVAVAAGYRTSEEVITLGSGEVYGELLLRAFPALNLTGTVRVDGAPCRDGYVSLSGPVSAHVRVSEEGSAIINGILAGSYEALVYCAWALPHTELLEVGPPASRRLWDLKGRPPSREINAPAVEAAYGTIRASLHFSTRGENSSVNVFAKSAQNPVRRANRLGKEFIFRELPLGEYEVYVGDTVNQTRHVVLESAGDDLRVDLEVPVRIPISGRVVDERGEPVPQAWVTHFRSEAQMSEIVSSGPELTDDDGTFTFEGFPNTDYTVVVVSPLGEAYNERIRAGSDTTVQLPSM